MDLYKLNGILGQPGSDFKFSWIAFDTDNHMRRVLFDSHPPKGPHFHIDDDMEGQRFNWISTEDTIRLFHEKVAEHFGELEVVPNDGGQEI